MQTTARTSVSTTNIDKSLITNLTVIAIVVASYFVPKYQALLSSVGYFALSGAITNWLAVHMLFEKVPFLYGSGVIPNKFEAFKAAIRNMIVAQFFSESNLKRFLGSQAQSISDLDLTPIVEKIDTDKLYEELVTAIMNSSFGGMLQMFGGEASLEPLRQPIIDKLTKALANLLQDSNNKQALAEVIYCEKSIASVQQQLQDLIDARLNELTPKMVKEIIQQMIKEHLGWLVVWGGVFGGIIGLVVNLVQNAV